MPFTVFIDESGESGIAKVRTADTPGASPYFVLGATVMQPATEIHGRRLLAEIRDTIGKKNWKHATDLDHQAKVFFARKSCELNARFFALISNKATLGEYKDKISNDPQKFYNKCVQYILEMVCNYLARFSVADDDISVVLEQRNHDYDSMLRFLTKVKANPIYPESKSLRLLNPFAIGARRKGEEELLDYADLIAHSVYQCTNLTRHNYNIPERRYLEELQSRFASAPNGLVLSHGIKCIHSLEQLQLSAEIETLFRGLRANRLSRIQYGAEEYIEQQVRALIGEHIGGVTPH